MLMRCLVVIGLCLTTSPLLEGSPLSSLIPQETNLSIAQLANGIKTIVQRSGRAKDTGSLRIVVKKPVNEETLYTFDGEMGCLGSLFFLL